MSAGGLLALLLALLLCNLPIAVAIGLASLMTILLLDGVSPLIAVQRMVAGVDSFHLMAVPLFMFAGLLMEKGGISRRLIDFANALVGWLPGGLAAVTIVSAMFFAGISGSAAADTAAVGAIMIPAMRKSGYHSDFACAVQAAGGSIGVIIPPSIPMIIFGYLTGASIGQLFAAGILPGLLIGLSLIVVSTLLSVRDGYRGLQVFSFSQVWRSGLRAFWALGAPVIVLGGILGGVFTATESAAIAVVYGLAVGMLVYRQLTVSDLWETLVEGSVLSAVVLFIIAAASMFTWVAAFSELPTRLGGWLLAISSDPIVLLLLINLLLLLAGTFVETTAALILLVPIIAPLQAQLGIDMVQLGVIVVTNLAIGMLTPPMGICLIVSAAISGRPVTAISRKVLPFLLILLADLLLITFWSPLTTLVPRLLR